MFKLVACLCFVLVFVNLASSCLEDDAKKLIRDVKKEVIPKIKEFEDGKVNWEKEGYDIIMDYRVQNEKNVNFLLKNFTDTFNDLKKKNETCVEDLKARIAALTELGQMYISCSDGIHHNIFRYMGDSIHLVWGFKDKINSFNKRLKKCKNIEPCLKILINNLKDDKKTFASQVSDYSKQIKSYTLNTTVLEKLKSCFRISTLDKAGKRIIKKIEACAGLT